MSSELLGELEVGAASEKVLNQGVERLPFRLGDADQVRVKGREDSDLGLAAGFSHGRDSNASDTMTRPKTRLAVSHHPAALVKGVSP